MFKYKIEEFAAQYNIVVGAWVMYLLNGPVTIRNYMVVSDNMSQTHFV